MHVLNAFRTIQVIKLTQIVNAEEIKYLRGSYPADSTFPWKKKASMPCLVPVKELILWMEDCQIMRQVTGQIYQNLNDILESDLGQIYIEMPVHADPSFKRVVVPSFNLNVPYINLSELGLTRKEGIYVMDIFGIKGASRLYLVTAKELYTQCNIANRWEFPENTLINLCG
jgi:hypothetical protein